jgi:hypothetical protein
MSYWNDSLRIAKRWIIEEQLVNKRILRLKLMGCMHVSWIKTYNLLNELLDSGYVSEIPNHTNWLTLPCYLDEIAQVKSTQTNHILNIKLWILENWNALSQSLSNHSELIFKIAFENAGYTVERRKNLPVANPFLTSLQLFSGVKRVQIDLLCKKSSTTLGVEIKSSISDVFMNPLTINSRTLSNQRIVRQAMFCSSMDYIPIFIAPFIDGSYYPFMDKYYGLNCHTYQQYFDPKNEDHVILYNFIKDFLNYKNVALVDRVPKWIERWIDRVPHAWNNRYGSKTGITIQ